MDRLPDITPTHRLHIALLPTDRGWTPQELAPDPASCSRCGVVFREDELPLLLWADDGRMWRFHFRCVGLVEPRTPLDDMRDEEV
jgi:hypothetical protein